MSSRALRRLQKQQEEERALQANQPAEEDLDHEHVPLPKQQSAFSALKDVADHEDNEEDDDGIRDEAEAFGAASHAKSIQDSTPNTVGSEVATPLIGKKKKKKKKKAKNEKSTASHADATEDDDEDIDAVLASLATTNISPSGPSTSSTSNKWAALGIDPTNLHAINEMRRLFGRDAIGDRPRQPQNAARGRGRHLPQQDQGHRFPAISLKRNLFVQGKEEWPRATTGGLGMEIVSKDPTTGVTEYRFVHSTAYQETQRQYSLAVSSFDPNRLVILLQNNPYHIATLLQVGEIMKHDRQHDSASDILERALFAFGRCVHSTFGEAVRQGKARLGFDTVENREFFLAGWRYIMDLSMRSTWRTVWEWAKMLFSLDPEGDPYALGLGLDTWALRANEASQFEEVRRATLKYSDEEGKEDPAFAYFSEPHSGWRRVLLYLRLGNMDKAKFSMRTAILNDPHTGHTLCRMLDIEPMPAVLWPYHEARNPVAALYTALYTTRAKDLWNNAEAKDLLVTTAGQISKEEVEDRANVPDFGDSDRSFPPNWVPVNVARHIHLLENDTLLRMLAACTVEGDSDGLGSRPTQDPYPPRGNIQSYDAIPPLGSGIANGMGEGAMPQEIRALLERLPPEQREQLIRGMRDIEEGRMPPGGFGDEDEDEDEDGA